MCYKHQSNADLKQRIIKNCDGLSLLRTKQEDNRTPSYREKTYNTDKQLQGTNSSKIL